jgi:DNA-binding NarL/FixJ family response regulator
VTFESSRRSVVSIRVLVCDAQPVVCAGMRTILERELDIKVVGEVGDGQEALAAVEALDPTIVITDIDLPTIDGIQVTRQIIGAGIQPIRKHPVGVIVVTARDDDEYFVQAVQAGARGFLLKDDPTEQLVYSVRMVAAGEAFLTPSVTRRLLEQFAGQLAAFLRAPADVFTVLTSRELEVLRLLALGRSNTQIAGALCIGEATVRSHTHHFLHKLGLRDRSQAVALAYQAGLVQPGNFVFPHCVDLMPTPTR